MELGNSCFSASNSELSFPVVLDVANLAARRFDQEVRKNLRQEATTSPAGERELSRKFKP